LGITEWGKTRLIKSHYCIILFTDAIIPTNMCYLHAETESVVHLKRQILAIEVIRWKLERTYARNKQDTLPIWYVVSQRQPRWCITRTVSQPETKSGCVIPATMRPKRYLVQKIQNMSLNIINSK
jgi:hypothetical protein